MMFLEKFRISNTYSMNPENNIYYNTTYKNMVIKFEYNNIDCNYSYSTYHYWNNNTYVQ